MSTLPAHLLDGGYLHKLANKTTKSVPIVKWNDQKNVDTVDMWTLVRSVYITDKCLHSVRYSYECTNVDTECGHVDTSNKRSRVYSVYIFSNECTTVMSEVIIHETTLTPTCTSPKLGRSLSSLSANVTRLGEVESVMTLLSTSPCESEQQSGW